MLLKLPGNMRSKEMVEYLRENNTQYGYLDQPECLRYIVSIVELHLGYIQVYETDRSNIAIGVGSCLFGHQDTVMTIINRGRSRLVKYETPLDLTPIVCP